MLSSVVEQLRTKAIEAAGLYYRLVLLVGRAGSGKTAVLQGLAAAEGWSRINLNQQLAESLLDLPRQQQPAQVRDITEKLLRNAGGGVLLLDNIELLFSPDLAQDPLRLLQALARNRTLVAAWPGVFDERALRYAEPGHPEEKSYPVPIDALIVAV